MKIKQALTALTTQAGLTQTEIANAVGCSQENIFYHMNNTAKKPRPSVDFVDGLKKLCRKHAKALAKAPDSLQ